MLKKYGKIIAVLLVTAIAFSGCGQKENHQEGKNTPSETTLEGNTSERESEEINVSNQETLGAKILTGITSHSDMVGTKDGMYRIAGQQLENGKYAKRIYYVDYASAQEIVLCNDASCKHNTETCMGVLEDERLIFPEIFVFQNKLYVFSPKNKAGSSLITFGPGGDDFFQSVEYPAILYQMNLDGTNRKLLTQFPDEVSVDEKVFEWNGKLIFCEKKVKEVDKGDGVVQYVGENRKMVCVDPESGKITDMVDFPEENIINGVFKDKFVCERYTFPDGIKEEDTNNIPFAEWKELMNKSKVTYFLFDVGTGEEKEICTLDCKEYFDDGVVFHGKLYLSTGTTKTACFDLETGERSEVTISKERPFVFVKSVGDRIYCWPKDHSDEAYFWDPETGELTKVDLTMKKTNLIIELCVFNEDSILGICEGDYKQAANYDKGYAFTSMKYGIYKKKDLYAGKNNYTIVSMCSNGMNE